MKPKEYVRKYKLNQNSKFNHNAFVADFTVDFMSLIEFHQSSGDWNYTKFQNCVNDIRRKWDGVSNKVAGGLPEKLWNYFYASVVVKVRDEYFGDFLRRQEYQREERRRERRERNAWRYQQRTSFWDFFFNSVFNELLQGSRMTTPTESFITLGLAPESSQDDVKKRFKELAFQHHPDKGGNEAKFRQIVEAKNRCLAYLA